MSTPCGWVAAEGQGRPGLGLKEAAGATEEWIGYLKGEVDRLGQEHGLAPGLIREVEDLGAEVKALRARLDDSSRQAAQIGALQRQVAELKASLEACHLGSGSQACDNRAHLKDAVRSILESITRLPKVQLSEKANGEFALSDGVDVYRAAYVAANVANALPAVSQLIECGRLEDAIGLIHGIKLPRIYRAGEHLSTRESHFSVAQVDCLIASAIDLLLGAKGQAGS
ncbi:MAG: hypothetical protein HY554_00170 [Elusimicrobia bacterium]|nr:hypothetical protein [Elusimicrobiota bacterium]